MQGYLSSPRMLKDSEFRGGLVAGVPSNIMVAHKFGESKLNNEKQFHDCGIVYFPKNQYLLCVMSRSSIMETLSLPSKAPPGWPMKGLTASCKSDDKSRYVLFTIKDFCNRPPYAVKYRFTSKEYNKYRCQIRQDP